MIKITDSSLEFEPKFVEIEKIIVRKRIRKVNEDHVLAIMKSFQDGGGRAQFQPIVVSADYVLADGAHRLEAAKRSGWTHIAAWISKEPLSANDIKFIEADANLVRRDFTPLEVEEIWQEIRPVLEAKAKANQAIGHLNLKQGTNQSNSPVILDYNNRETESVDQKELAKKVTGMSLDQLEKVSAIKRIAESDNAPVELRESAKKGLNLLATPDSGGSIGTVFNALTALQARLDQQQMSKEELQRALAEKKMDALIEKSTSLANHLNNTFGDDIRTAYKLSDLAKKDLVSARLSLIHAVSRLTAIEVVASSNPLETLRKVGEQVQSFFQEKTGEYMQEEQKRKEEQNA